jgi:predicted transposase/invertase (TIGR01784 family)
MAEKGNEENVKEFVNAILENYGIQYDNIKLISDKVLHTQTRDDKLFRVDLKAKGNNKDNIIIEVQQQNAKEFIPRLIHYATRSDATLSKIGEKTYYKTIVIAIMDFIYFNDENFHERFYMRGEKNKNYILTDKIMIILIELPKFRKLKEIDLNNKLHQWCIFFSQKYYKEEFKEVLKMYSIMDKINIQIDKLLGDGEYEERLIRDQLKIHEIKTEGKIEGIEEGRIEGIEEGMEKGKIEGMKEIAIKLKNKGNSLEEIAEITNLPIETIKKII